MFGSFQQIKWVYVKSISLFLKWNSESSGMFRYLIQNNPVPTLTKLIQNYNVTADNRTRRLRQLRRTITVTKTAAIVYKVQIINKINGK